MQCAKKNLAGLCTVFSVCLSMQGIAAAAESGSANFDVDSFAESGQTMAQEGFPVSSALLDDMRGGFDTGSGLKISFGIQREVYMNENLLASANLAVGDINKATSEHALKAVADPVLYLVQNGSGNRFDPDVISQSVTPIVIQNTLNQQDIRSLTVLNARVNSIELFKNLNMQSALTEAIGQFGGTK